MSTATADTPPRQAAELLSEPIGTLRHEERLRLLSALLHAHGIGQLLLEDLAPDAVVLAFSEDAVPPGQPHTVQRRCYDPFRASRLVVLPVEYEEIDESNTETETQSGAWFWRRVRRESHRRRESRLVSVSPEAWDLRQLYIGSRNAMPTATAAPGMSLASIELPQAAREITVPAGVDFTIAVSHRLQRPVPFRALVLGRLAPP